MQLFAVHAVVVQVLALLSAVHTQLQSCSGQCVVIVDCPSMLELLKNIQSGFGPPDGIQQLRKAICDQRDGNLYVCCENQDIAIELPPDPTTSTTVLPTICGNRPLVDKVINGENAPLFAWPWMALLQSQNLITSQRAFVCGGVIISERYILTAAHCVDEGTSRNRLESVRIGEHTISTNPDCIKGFCTDPHQDIGVEQIITHENYGQPFGCRNCNDIALLRLARAISFDTASVKPVCLPQNLERDLGFSLSQLIGKFAWIVGWGTTDSRRPKPADVVQQSSIPIERELCKFDLGVFPNQDMVLCAGGNGSDTCRGDSGGPMLMSSDGDLNYYVVGIVSRGPRICNAKRTGGIYTNVNFYIPWILKHMKP